MSAANCTIMTYEGSIKAKTKVNSSREVIAKNKQKPDQSTNQPPPPPRQNQTKNDLVTQLEASDFIHKSKTTQGWKLRLS